MKKLFNKKGLSLLETIVAIAILAAIALPMLSIFANSAKTDEKARGVLNANYISQDYTEKLAAVTYKQALSNIPNRQEIDGYYLSAKIQPYGSIANSSGSSSDYSHLIVYSDGTMLAVMPDGKWTVFTSIPSDITYSNIGNRYTFTAGSASLSGDLEYSDCVITINAMQQIGDVNVSLNTSSLYKTVLYSQSYYTDNYSSSGTFEVIEDLLLQDTSLVHVTTYVYDDAFSSDSILSMESYISLDNWE